MLELRSAPWRALLHQRRSSWLGASLLLRPFPWGLRFGDGHAAVVTEASSLGDFGATVGAGLAHLSFASFQLPLLKLAS
jgi:hypothetical protein